MNFFLILWFIFENFEQLKCEKVSGDVGTEPGIVPAINLADILNNIPTIPPLVFPTIDPNFWKSFTLPPLPTLDPNFWNNLPTLAPLVFPTLDPNFLQNLPTLPPLPTLDPNFWKNLPTLAPLVLPTLDPNFLKNLPTLPPLPTLDPNFWQKLLPTPTPKTAQCTYILAQEIQNDTTFARKMNFTNVNSTIDLLLEKAKEKCTGFQAQKLVDLAGKYQVLIADFQAITPYFSAGDLKTLLLAILQGDSAPNFQLFLANPEVVAKLSKASVQISTLQFELQLHPI